MMTEWEGLFLPRSSLKSLEGKFSTNLAAPVSMASPRFFWIRASWVRASTCTSSSDGSTLLSRALVWHCRTAGLDLDNLCHPLIYLNSEVSSTFPANGCHPLCPAQPAGWPTNTARDPAQRQAAGTAECLQPKSAATLKPALYFISTCFPDLCVSTWGELAARG